MMICEDREKPARFWANLPYFMVILLLLATGCLETSPVGRGLGEYSAEDKEKLAAFKLFKEMNYDRILEEENEDCLRLTRQTPIDLILAGTTADGLNLPCSAVSKTQVESILNDILVEWKSKGLAALLQRSNSSQLNDLVVKIEKGILKLDLKAKELNDAADEDARQVKAPGAEAPARKAPGALKLSHLLDQRKTILGVILGSVKQAAAQRATAGG